VPQVLRVGRVVRLFRILRILRGVRSARVIMGMLFRHRARGALAAALLMGFVLLVVCSIAILNVETAPRSNIRTAEDALWWGVSTMTMGGYGDCYPVTTAGRLVAVVLMTAGMALFGVFTAYVAALFLDRGTAAPK
jgi:voltage-gated potassium channel